MVKKKEERNETLSEYIEQTAEKKNKTPGECWESTIQNMGKCQLASHIGKFTNPDSSVALLVQPQEPDAGYVTTQGCRYREDILTPAQYMGSASLLLKNQEDGRNVLEWAESSPEMLDKELQRLNLKASALTEAVSSLQGKSGKDPDETDERLKQVYFPVSADQTYHLLTVLPASSLLLELKQRLRQMSSHRRLCYSEKEELYGEDCEDILNLTEIGFGGTKPQNVSALNSRSGGSAYLLPSLPPVFNTRNRKLPKKDFFRNGLLLRMTGDSLRTLHHLFLADRNNLQIRENIRTNVDTIADIVISIAEQMRTEPEGWSREENFAELPESQKIWLDESYREQRLSDERWIDEVGTAFGRWLIYAYSRIAGQEKVGLGDEELQFFKNRLTDVLKEEVRLEK